MSLFYARRAKFLVLLLLNQFFSECHGVGNFKPLENPTNYRRQYKPIQLVGWKYQCRANQCVRFNPNELSEEDYVYNYVEGCKSICGPYGSLWPYPTGDTVILPYLKAFNIEDIAVKFDTKETDEYLEENLTQAWSIFSQYLALMKTEIKGFDKNNAKAGGGNKKSHVLVKISVTSKNLDLSLKTKEEYSITINTIVKEDKPRDEIIVVIHANTFYGARHALESLSQLITYDPHEKCHKIPQQVSLQDRPTYPYRGILLDTGRNYYSIDSIKRVIDAMSYNKLNVLHWHMNEQQSFPFVSERVPNLTRYGAYSAEQVYYKDEIKGLVMYARQRGVLLLPEFDAPAHAAFGWQFGQAENLGKLVTCFDYDWEDESGSLAAEPPAGQLNPVNENLYPILGELYKDLIEAFTPMHSEDALKMFHLGGDEVNFRCWQKSPEIIEWLRDQNLPTDALFNPEGYLYLWSVFQEKALQELVKSNGGQKFVDGIILWTSELTKPAYISKFLDVTKYVIQVWTTGTDLQIGELLRQRYRLILSNYDAWYLDCGYGSWLYSGAGPENNWCSPFKGWKTIYQNNIRHMVEVQGLDWNSYGKLILGGEAAMWSEQVDDFSVEAKLWPRGCAFAERLWSDPQDTTWREAEPRLHEQRKRMAYERGIHADAFQPEFCRLHEGRCYTLRKYATMTANDFPGNSDNSGNNNNNNGGLEVQRHSTANSSRSFWRKIFSPGEIVKWSIILIFIAILIVRRRFIVGTFTSLLRSVKFISIR